MGYTANVGTSISQITVTPTTSDSDATVEYLDASDAAIADADGMTEGQQVDLEHPNVAAQRPSRSSGQNRV